MGSPRYFLLVVTIQESLPERSPSGLSLAMWTASGGRPCQESKYKKYSLGNYTNTFADADITNRGWREKPDAEDGVIRATLTGCWEIESAMSGYIEFPREMRLEAVRIIEAAEENPSLEHAMVMWEFIERSDIHGACFGWYVDLPCLLRYYVY